MRARAALACLSLALLAPGLAAAASALTDKERKAVADEAARFVAQCREHPEPCVEPQRRLELGRAFLLVAEQLWREDGLIDEEDIANGLLLAPDEPAPWIDALPDEPESGPSPWVVGLAYGVPGLIPSELPGEAAVSQAPGRAVQPVIPPPPLPPVRLFVWRGGEDLSPDEAVVHGALGVQGHIRVHGGLAAALQVSMDLVGGARGELAPAVGNWIALGGARLLPPALGPGHPQMEVDLLIGGSNHALWQGSYYLVDGAFLPAFLTLRHEVRWRCALGPGIELGPTLRLETQPILTVRRTHVEGGSHSDELRLHWNVHSAMGGAQMRFVIHRGMAVQAEFNWGIANWGDHRISTPVATVKIGFVFGEGLEGPPTAPPLEEEEEP